MKNDQQEEFILPDEREYPNELTRQYELLECLSEREEARTILARDRGSGELCVVKCFLRESPLYGRSEPEGLKSLQDPPFPRFCGEYTGEKMRCVVRRYVPGTPLSEAMQERTWTPEEVIGVGTVLCDQLTILHSLPEPVIHRDIKPENVIMDREGAPVLIDFGISRTVSGKDKDTVVGGTTGYAPPEQYGFTQTDSRADIYSLGILLHRLLLNNRGDGESSGRGEQSSNRRQWEALERVIAKCCEFDPERRYESAEKLKAALLAAGPESRRKKKSLWIAAAACIAVIILGVGILAFTKQAESVSFSDPLIEEAVRLNLGLGKNEKISRDMLEKVSALYIVSGTAYADSDSFYEAVNQWYATQERPRGEIETLEDLERMPALKEVCIVIQKISDISVLSGLKDLSKIELKHNQITDLSPVSGMEHLTSVGINDNPVRDISPLLECPGLAFLDLCDVKGYDPSVIGELGDFQYLDISNQTDSYRYLSGKNIYSLRIEWSSLDDLTVLDGVSGLEELKIGHTHVTDLSPLAKHTGLKRLNIAAVPAKDLSVLKALPLLEEVTVSEDMIELVEKLGDVPFTVHTG